MLWVFGYGSLIWKPPPHAVEQRSGYVKSVIRRFAQSSIDHRGTPDKPGRVVTVIDAEDWHKVAGVTGKGGTIDFGARVGVDRNHNGEGDGAEEQAHGNSVHSNGIIPPSPSATTNHPTEADQVWGVAYRIAEDKEEEVWDYLVVREQNGYTDHDVAVYSTDLETKKEVVVVPKAKIWIGKLDNPAFVGCEDIDYLARRIYECKGPSGPNKDYLYKLAQSVRTLYPLVKDDYLFDLEARMKAIDNNQDES